MDAGPEPALVLSFPSRAVGELSRHDSGTGAWLPFAAARGAVAVHADDQLALSVDSHRRVDLTFLDALPVRPFARLRLAGLLLVPDDYRRLAQFAWLRELDLDGCGADTADLAALRPLVNLVELRLGGSLVDSRGLRALDFPLLRRLDLDHSAVTGGLGALDQLTRLERLDLSATNVGDDALPALAALPQLRHLNLSHTELSMRGAGLLGRFPALEHVVLAGVPLDAPAAHEVAGLPRLRLLDLANSDVDDSAVAAITRADALEQLRLSGNPVGDVAAAWLEALPALSRLWLDDTEVGDAALARLVGLPSLEELVLDGTAVSSAGVAALAGHPALSRLDLARTAVDDDALAILPSLPALAELDLSGTPVTDSGLLCLARCPRLRSLRVAGTQVTRAGLWRLVEALPALDLPDLGLAPAAPVAAPTPAAADGGETAVGQDATEAARDGAGTRERTS